MSQRQTYRAPNGNFYDWFPKRTATHECGHAVITHVLGVPVGEVFLVGSGDPDLETELDAQGICGASRKLGNPIDPEDRIVIALAGMFAEVLLLDDRSPNADDFASGGVGVKMQKLMSETPALLARVSFDVEQVR